MIFSLSYKVVFGDQHDRNFGFVVTDFNGKIVKENYEDLEGNMQVNAKESGVYNICIGNQASRFYSKKIHIYLDLFNPKRFESAVEEETEKDHSFGNISKTIMVLNEGIRNMRLYQMRTRQNSIHDWYILSANLAYVNRWSCVQCIVIIASGILQVYILRTLFTVPTNTRKPRC
ncbi:transmembrane emp24 domain-containing protein 6-like isoform X2 [Antedon mediterranea]